jgi:hypothetical protein
MAALPGLAAHGDYYAPKAEFADCLARLGSAQRHPSRL